VRAFSWKAAPGVDPGVENTAVSGPLTRLQLYVSAAQLQAPLTAKSQEEKLWRMVPNTFLPAGAENLSRVLRIEWED